MLIILLLIMELKAVLEHSWEECLSNIEEFHFKEHPLMDDQLLYPLSGTLDDFSLHCCYPDREALKEVDEEYRHPTHWSKEEDDLLAKLVDEIGQDWAAIKNYFAYKKQGLVRKRWMAKHDPSVKREKWSEQG